MPSPTPGFMPSADAISLWRYEALPVWKAARTAGANGSAEPFCGRGASALTTAGDRTEPSSSRPKMPVSDFMLAPFCGRDVSPDATAGLPALGNREPADCDIRRIKTEPRTAASTVPRLNCPESLSAKKALLGIRNPDRQRRCRIDQPAVAARAGTVGLPGGIAGRPPAGTSLWNGDR